MSGSPVECFGSQDSLTNCAECGPIPAPCEGLAPRPGRPPPSTPQHWPWRPQALGPQALLRSCGGCARPLGLIPCRLLSQSPARGLPVLVCAQSWLPDWGASWDTRQKPSCPGSRSWPLPAKGRCLRCGSVSPGGNKAHRPGGLSIRRFHLVVLEAGVRGQGPRGWPLPGCAREHTPCTP